MRQEYREALGPPTARHPISPLARELFVEELRGSLARSRSHCADAGTASQGLRLPLDEQQEHAVRWTSEDGRVLLDATLHAYGAQREAVPGGSGESRRAFVQLFGTGKAGCWVEACFEARAGDSPLRLVPTSSGAGREHVRRWCKWLRPTLEGTGLLVRGIPLNADSIELTVELRAAAVRPAAEP